MSISISVEDTPGARSQTQSPRRFVEGRSARGVDDDNAPLDFGGSSDEEERPRGVPSAPSASVTNMQMLRGGLLIDDTSGGEGSDGGGGNDADANTAPAEGARRSPSTAQKKKRTASGKRRGAFPLERFTQTTASRRAHLARPEPAPQPAATATKKRHSSAHADPANDKGLLAGQRLFSYATSMQADLEAARKAREEAEAREVAQFPFRPTVSRYSQELVQLSLYKPPSERFGLLDRHIADRRRILKEHERITAEEEELQRCTFRPAINGLSRRIVRENRSLAAQQPTSSAYESDGYGGVGGFGRGDSFPTYGCPRCGAPDDAECSGPDGCANSPFVRLFADGEDRERRLEERRREVDRKSVV